MLSEARKGCGRCRMEPINSLKCALFSLVETPGDRDGRLEGEDIARAIDEIGKRVNVFGGWRSGSIDLGSGSKTCKWCVVRGGVLVITECIAAYYARLSEFKTATHQLRLFDYLACCVIS